MTIFHVISSPGGKMVLFFNYVGLGYTQHTDELESSLTLTIKLWKFNTFLTFSLA